MAAIEEKILSDGRYRLLRIIGKGGMSTVYLVSDNHTGKLWAAKEVTGDPGLLKKEADHLKRLDFPAFPRIVDLVFEEGRQYLIMDYLPGKSVGALLREGRHFSDAEIVTVGCCLCEALRYLHRQNPPVLYLDLKPDNILITPEGRVMLIDFGIATTCCDQGETMGYGTPGYAAPEQYDGRCDPRTDLYGLGSVLLSMSGRGKRRGRLLRRILKRCTDKDPRKRYRSADELAEKMQKAQRRVRQKHKGIYLATAAFLMCVVIGSRAGVRLGQTMYRETMDEIYEKLAIEEGFSELCALCDKAICLEPSREEGYLALLEAGVQQGHTQEGIFLVYRYRRLYPNETKMHDRTLERIAQLYFCGNVLDEAFIVDYEKVEEICLELGEDAAQCLKLESEFIRAAWVSENRNWEQAAVALEKLAAQAGNMVSMEEQYELLVALAELSFCYEEELAPYLEGEKEITGIQLLLRAAELVWEEPMSAAAQKREVQAKLRLGDSIFRFGMQEEMQNEQLEAALTCYDELKKEFLTVEEKRHVGMNQVSICLALGKPELAEEYLMQVSRLPGAEKEMEYQRLKKRLERMK